MNIASLSPRHTTTATAPAPGSMAAARHWRGGLQVVLPWLLALSGAGALAQDGAAVYRCPDGQYRQAPCPGGRPVDTGVAPTPQQQAEARQAAATQARLAEQLRQERHARERAAVQAPARIGPVPAAAASRPGEHPAKKRARQPKGRASGTAPTGR